MKRGAYILYKPNEEVRPFRLVKVDGNGKSSAVTGWCKDLKQPRKKAQELNEREGYESSMIREDDANTEQQDLFGIVDRYGDARKNGDSGLITANGYEFGEVASALQKSIRRGEEEQAMWWAGELEQKYYRYLWRRLLVITGEDIGLAEPMGPAIVGALHQNYMWYREVAKKPDDHMTWNILGHAILWMCRAKKSREVNEFAFYVFKGWAKDRRPEIPEYALDKHTKRGREMGRDMKHFFLEASRLENESDEVEQKYRWFIEEQIRA